MNHPIREKQCHECEQLSCANPELINYRKVVTIEDCLPPKYEVACYVCEQCNEKYDFLCDFQYHLVNHSESGRQYVEIFFCGEFSREAVKNEIKNQDFIINVQYPLSHLCECETSCCYIPCHLCGAEYEVVYAVKHSTRTCWLHELEYYNDHKHNDADKKSKWNSNGYTFHPYYVGCRPEKFTNLERRILKTKCFSIIVLAKRKFEEMDLYDKLVSKYPKMMDIKIGESIPFSEYSSYLQAARKDDQFTDKLKKQTLQVLN